MTSLEQNGIGKQSVYVPVRSNEELRRNINSALAGTRYYFSKILKPWHRVFFRTKIKAIFSNLERHLDVREHTVIHAHFLYSDGAVALRAFEKFGIPYVVTVRNTDINSFMRLRPDLLGICIRILKNSSGIVFIAPSYVKKLLNKIPSEIHEELLEKIHVVPNGVAQFWLDRQAIYSDPIDRELRLLYVGDFSRNKNVPGIIQSTELIREKRDVMLTLVGVGGDGEHVVSSMLNSGRYPYVTSVGQIRDREKLIEIYRSNDVFVMPSFFETFGVVYIEALSQGLPVVVSSGQGVDGYFDNTNVCASVDPSDRQSIADGILNLAEDLAVARQYCIEQGRRFGWANIAEELVNIYSSTGNDAGNEQLRKGCASHIEEPIDDTVSRE